MILAEDSIDVESLLKWNRPVPRYTSYPTAVQFQPLGFMDVELALHRYDKSKQPLSVYIHIPFCKTMCLFCGCSVILNRRPEKQAEYVELLCQEIRLFSKKMTSRKRISQLHFGGGTPTNLTEREFRRIFDTLRALFQLEGEISIEIDPRTVSGDGGSKLRFLKEIGFNRVSFGVQDLDPQVQEAVRRRQTEEMTAQTFHLAKEVGFSGINLDLIYGLPYQTIERFSRTAEKIAELKPDRIALFSYAKIPWLKLHQKAMPEQAEPSAQEKLSIYLEARRRFLDAGYTAIGMDHFSLPEDSLTEALHNKTLYRNFQGYSHLLAEDMAGFGISSVGHMGQTLLQNVKTIEEYTKEIKAGRLPIYRGFVCSKDDDIRAFVIQRLMCHFELDKQDFKRVFGHSFDEYFSKCRAPLLELQKEGLLQMNEQKIVPTQLGKLFIRIIASVFDVYLKPQETQFSQSI